MATTLFQPDRLDAGSLAQGCPIKMCPTEICPTEICPIKNSKMTSTPLLSNGEGKVAVIPSRPILSVYATHSVYATKPARFLRTLVKRALTQRTLVKESGK